MLKRHETFEHFQSLLDTWVKQSWLPGELHALVVDDVPTNLHVYVFIRDVTKDGRKNIDKDITKSINGWLASSLPNGVRVGKVSFVLGENFQEAYKVAHFMSKADNRRIAPTLTNYVAITKGMRFYNE